MSARLKRIMGRLSLSRGAAGHEVQVRLNSEPDTVIVEVLRDSRRDAKSDLRLALSLTSARDLQRALQGAVDEGYRLQAERERQLKLPADLNAAVASVGRELAEGGQ